ncbi:MAG: GIY-YIG nuclease family protein [Planctomycetota bacterium]|nr:GIY-YIG nuclease family protein [Planctomycetota bacterium]MDA1112997.1 GIY-YIG nuclease family protein [Planctomycetota bacterium]
MPKSVSAWSLYLLRSTKEERTYVGVTVDMERRLRQHNGELPGGAKATRRGRPWALARILGTYVDRSEAQQAEAAFKRLTGEQRLLAKSEDSR